MPRHSRSSRAPSGFLIEATSTARTPVFTLPAHYRALQRDLSDALSAHPLKLIAYCLMPDQWQLVVGQTDPTCLNRYLTRVTSARQAASYEGFCVGVQPLLTVADLLRVARDTERLALRSGLVRRAQDWPWNSLSERLQPTGRLDMVPAPFLASHAWVDFVNTARPEDQASSMRGAAVTRRQTRAERGP